MLRKVLSTIIFPTHTLCPNKTRSCHRGHGWQLHGVVLFAKGFILEFSECEVYDFIFPCLLCVHCEPKLQKAWIYECDKTDIGWVAVVHCCIKLNLAFPHDSTLPCINIVTMHSNPSNVNIY